METHLRLILFLVGSIILALVIWDVLRQLKLKKLQDALTIQDQFDPDFEHESRQQSLDFGEPDEDPWLNSKEFEQDIKVQSASCVPILTQSQYNTDKYEQVSIVNNNKDYSLDDMFALFVMARDPQGFDGSKLKRLLESANLIYGDMRIFHKYENNNENEVMFSVASAVEPGFFDINKLDTQFVSGVTMFMVFSNVGEPKKAFDALVRTAKQLAFGLNGELRDQHHKPLTLQIINSYKHNLEAYVG